MITVHLFFYRSNFDLWRLLLIIILYYQTKTLIDIQQQDILPIELIGTHDTINSQILILKNGMLGKLGIGVTLVIKF